MKKEAIADLTSEEKEYNLKCVIKIIRQSYKEVSDGRIHESSSVLLLPDMEATETSRFFSVYLPDIASVCLECGNEDLRIYNENCPKCDSSRIYTEHSEVPSWIGNPVHSPCRLAVLRKNNYCTQHHLFVMSTGVEDELRNMNGRSVLLTILPTSQDEVCDTAKSFNRTAKN